MHDEVDDPSATNHPGAQPRGEWPVRKHVLGQEPDDDLRGSTTAEERLAMMWPLALEAWRVAGLPIPEYERKDAPSRLVRGPKE